MDLFDVSRPFPTFERYLDIRDPGPPPDRTPDRCTGCLRPGTPMSTDGYCETCLRYQFGYDEAQFGAVKALLGGAVKAAFHAGIDPDLIRRVVDTTIDEQRELDQTVAAARR